MVEQYQLEKWIWSDADFDVMGWHDSQVYAITFLPETFEFALDLDYIFQWVHPAPGETYFKFWVVPATLVFSDVDELNINIETGYGGGLEIADINRTDPQEIQAGDFAGQKTWRYTIEAQEGEINFRAFSYKQYIRKKPVFGQAQSLEMDVRGGISFYRGLLDE